MVIDFDCIVVICALLLFVTFLLFSFSLSVFLSFLHEDQTFTMYYRWPALIAYKSSLAASGRQL